MPTTKKPTTTSTAFRSSEIAAAKAKAIVSASRKAKVDWRNAPATSGGGVTATIAALRKMRGPNKKPAKEQIDISVYQDGVSAFRASKRSP